jgi:hypothetical protein
VNKLLHSLIVWILLLAVPLQGFAAATMMLCAPQVANAAAVPGASHDHQAMLAAQASGHHDQHAVSRHDGDGDKHDRQAGGKCGACSACCYGAAMAPSDSLPMSSGVPAFESIPFAAGHAPTVDLAGPERPPQS